MTKRLAPGSRSITRESDVASLVMARLKRTDLTGATVIDADLRGALLEGTKLANANIIGARIRKRHVNDYVTDLSQRRAWAVASQTVTGIVTRCSPTSTATTFLTPPQPFGAASRRSGSRSNMTTAQAAGVSWPLRRV